MQVTYTLLKNQRKTLWCNCKAKRDRHKLVNFVVPDKSEKFPGSQRNWDMEISIYVADTSLRRGEVSCSSFLCSSRREAYPVSTSLGEVHHGCMGFVSNSRGIGSCVSGTPSFVGQQPIYETQAFWHLYNLLSDGVS
jgi:hypothetical protein